jgi:hypothetical protein
MKRFIVLHGGTGPVPGTDEARREGCICPGAIGERDRWGCSGGCTVDNECRIHGWVARRIHDMSVRQKMLREAMRLERMAYRKHAEAGR